MLRIRGDRVDLGHIERVLLVGAGKAAPAMAQGVVDVLDGRITEGTITTKHGHALPVPGIEVWEAGHPLPDAHGLAGASAALEMARGAGANDLLLCLLSGGASALWPAPPGGVSLGELRQVTNALLRAGAPIRHLNAVRKHLSRISGGQLARAARPARVLTLGVSDVVGAELGVIASGPTVPDLSTFGDALAVLDRYGVGAPLSVRRHLERGAADELPETPKPGDPVFEGTTVHIVANNRDALASAARAARRRGFKTFVVTDTLEGEARDAARDVVSFALRVRKERASDAPPVALLYGGETTVTVRGDGRGGRNQELALAAAMLLDGKEGVLLASMGTDGTDGPTDAAGGMVDGATTERGKARGLDIADHLRRNDAYPFLQATGDLLVTGPTGTNVNDVVLVLVN